jgi:hypothetical protein
MSSTIRQCSIDFGDTAAVSRECADLVERLARTLSPAVCEYLLSRAPERDELVSITPTEGGGLLMRPSAKLRAFLEIVRALDQLS